MIQPITVTNKLIFHYDAARHNDKHVYFPIWKQNFIKNLIGQNAVGKQ